MVQLPRLTAEMTAFIRKTAEYNLAPLGMVLKMVLGMKSNQLPKQKVTLYGLKIKNENLDGIRITEARKAVFDFLDGGLEAEKEEIISATGASSGIITAMIKSGFLYKKTYLSTKKPKNKKST